MTAFPSDVHETTKARMAEHRGASRRSRPQPPEGGPPMGRHHAPWPKNLTFHSRDHGPCLSTGARVRILSGCPGHSSAGAGPSARPFHVHRRPAPPRRRAARHLSTVSGGSARQRLYRRDPGRLRHPHAVRHRQLALPAGPAGRRLPEGRRGRAARGHAAGPACLPDGGAGTARRRHRHQRPVTHSRAGDGPLAAHEPHSGDQRRGRLGACPGRRGEGPAQRRAPPSWPLLRPRAVHLQPGNAGRHDQHRRQRPGQLHLRQDARPRAGAGLRAAGRRALRQPAGG